MYWFLRTGSLSLLMAGVAFLVFVLAILFSEWILQNYWRGDDDWLWLTLPVGGIAGLIFGLRYHRRKWIHPVSVTIGMLPVALLLFMWYWSSTQASPLAAGLGQALTAAAAVTFAVTAAVCLIVAALAKALLCGLRCWLAPGRSDAAAKMAEDVSSLPGSSADSL